MANAVKVGIFMTIALVVVGYIILKAEDIRLFRPEGKRIHAVFPTVAGLDERSPVRVAGVRVGLVDTISLEGGRAVATLLLDEPLGLTEGTYAMVTNLGLLGDKYVELVPGPEGAAPLPEGATIPGRAPASIDQVMASVSQLGDSLRAVTGQLSGELEVEGPLGRLVVSLEQTSGDLRDLVAANRAQVDATVDNFHQVSATLARELPRISEQLGGLLGEVRAVVAENRGALGRSLENVEQLTTTLQGGVEDLNQVAARLARGEGTLGKLLTSDEAHEELVTALQSVEGGVDALTTSLRKISDIELYLSMEGTYLEGVEESRGAFEIEVDPQSGRRYRVGVVDSPQGKDRSKTQTITTTHADGSTTTEVIQTNTVEDDTTLTALFGLPAGDRFRLWTGMIESSFGVEVQYLPGERWWLGAEAFDFDRPQDLDAHLRFTAGWRLHPNVYLLGGVDDPLTDELRSLFLGAGLRWRDDDLKYLLGSIPRF